MKQKTTVRGWRIPPNSEFTFTTLLDLNRRIGARVQLKYSVQQREFIAFTEGKKRARKKLSMLLRAFPEQTIRL